LPNDFQKNFAMLCAKLTLSPSLIDFVRYLASVHGHGLHQAIVVLVPSILQVALVRRQQVLQTTASHLFRLSAPGPSQGHPHSSERCLLMQSPLH
jgi:hypothetical protein